MPHLSRNGLYRRDGLRRCGYGDRTLQFHARFQIVNSEFSAVNRSPGAIRHIGEMPNGAVFHFDH